MSYIEKTYFTGHCSIDGAVEHDMPIQIYRNTVRHKITTDDFKTVVYAKSLMLNPLFSVSKRRCVVVISPQAPIYFETAN